VKNNYSPSTLRRRDEIARLVRAEPVRSQDELQHRLRQRGIAVAQPTLSRDLKALGAVKSPAGYVAPDAAGTPPGPDAGRDERLVRALREFVLSIRAAGSLVVLRTPPAGAHPVARALDEARLPDVAGTIAGDDTVFVAAQDAAAAASLARRLAGAGGARRRSTPRAARA
jgi:transcriptional regulator of arginine metabolism